MRACLSDSVTGKERTGLTRSQQHHSGFTVSVTAGPYVQAQGSNQFTCSLHVGACNEPTKALIKLNVELGIKLMITDALARAWFFAGLSYWFSGQLQICVTQNLDSPAKLHGTGSTGSQDAC